MVKQTTAQRGGGRGRESTTSIDVRTLERDPPPQELRLNDIGRVRLRTSTPLVIDPYKSNRRTGSFILIDEASNEYRRRGHDHEKKTIDQRSFTLSFLARMFEKVLMANRGEIALRVSVRWTSSAWRASPSTQSSIATRPTSGTGRRGIQPGWRGGRENYLGVEKILDVAERAGAQAIHPGYGFLAENALRADCEQAGIVSSGRRRATRRWARRGAPAS